jgi:hypothetical protein
MMGSVTNRRARCIGVFVVGSILLNACGTRPGPSTSRHTATGVIAGRVTAGPACPVEQVGHPCPPRLLVVEVQATAAGRIVASTQSGGNGTYRFELPRGTYTLTAVTQNALPRCPPRTVTVTTAHTTGGDITCDTGIR